MTCKSFLRSTPHPAWCRAEPVSSSLLSSLPYGWVPQAVLTDRGSESFLCCFPTHSIMELGALPLSLFFPPTSSGFLESHSCCPHP
jgi:hypothetical protein